MKRFLFALVVLVAAHPVFAEANRCDYRGPGPFLFWAGHDAEGYFVRLGNSEEVQTIIRRRPDFHSWVTKGMLPPRANYWPQFENLAQEAGVAVFCAGPGSAGRGSWPAQTLAPVPLDAVWRGVDPVSSLRSFAHAAGLELITPEPGFWLVGPHELVQHAAFVAYAYPIDPDSQTSRGEEELGNIGRALLAQLPIRMVEGTPDWIGVGYYWIPEEPDTLFVVTTHGHRAPRYKLTLGGELDEQVFKVRLRSEAGKPSIECVWGAGVTGPLLLGVSEDFDGDGYRDFVFESPEVNTVPTLILSGATGTPLARLSTLRLAVQKDSTGPKKLLADGAWQDYESRGPQLFTYSEEAKAYKTVPAAPVASAQGTGQAAKAPSWTETRFAAPLAAQVGGFDHLRVYFFPDGAAEAMPEGTEQVKLRWPAAWLGWVVNEDPQETFEKRQKDFPVHVLLSYFSPGYLKELEARRQGRVQR